jgi:release factor glutamine methyltransferase
MKGRGHRHQDAVVSPASADQWSDSDPWTLLRLILWSSEYLEGKGLSSGRLDAEYLLAHVLGTGRLQLYMDFERPLKQEELNQFRPLLKRRASREPLQYILGCQPFRELELIVRPGVLIPRPETEQLVDEVLQWFLSEEVDRPTALDIGTGSGAIALSLAAESGAKVVATDISSVALDLARSNAEAAGLEALVEFREGSIFEPIPATARFDAIVSNPPYVREKDEPLLEPEVLDWEPREALFSGKDGLDVIRDLVAGAFQYLRPGGLLALEVGLGQAREVALLLEDSGYYASVKIKRDHATLERFVIAYMDMGDEYARAERPL